MHDPAKVLVGHRVLVLEDRYFIAEEITTAVQAAGAAVEGPYGHIEQAKAALQVGGFDLAVLDIRLQGGSSLSIADELERQGLGYVFATGYAPVVMPPKWRHVPLCEKPFSGQEVVEALVSVAKPPA